MHTCLNYNRTEEQIPLLNLNFKGGEQHICPQCLPLLIHKPQVLAEKLPGMEAIPPAEH